MQIAEARFAALRRRASIEERQIEVGIDAGEPFQPTTLALCRVARNPYGQWSEEWIDQPP